MIEKLILTGLFALILYSAFKMSSEPKRKGAPTAEDKVAAIMNPPLPPRSSGIPVEDTISHSCVMCGMGNYGF